LSEREWLIIYFCVIQLIPTPFLQRFGFHQPDEKLALTYFKWVAVIGLIFASVYTLAGDWAMGADRHYNFAFEWEENIPMFGPAVWIYFSVILLFVLPPFALRQNDIHRMGYALCTAILFSGVIFVLFPAPVIWPGAAQREDVTFALRLLHQIDPRANTLPSLHVVYATVIVSFVTWRVPQAKLWLWSWWALICSSVLFVHQHHVLDIFAAVALSWVVFRFFRYEQGLRR